MNAWLSLVVKCSLARLFWVLVLCMCHACFIDGLPRPGVEHTLILGIHAYLKLDGVVFGQTVRLCLVFGIFALVFLSLLNPVFLLNSLCTPSGAVGFLVI